MTKLDALLASIDPSRTLDPTAADADRALNTFPMRSAVFTNWDAYVAFMSQLVCHIENTILHLNPPRPVSPPHDWSHCISILQEEFGSEGFKAAFEMVRTGNEGGLLAVTRVVAKRMGSEYAQNQINARVYFYYKDLTASDRMAAVGEYVAKYGHLLPSEITEGQAARLLLNLQKVLEDHPRLIQRMRRVG